MKHGEDGRSPVHTARQHADGQTRDETNLWKHADLLLRELAWGLLLPICLHLP
jgi:hypothetical protein